MQGVGVSSVDPSWWRSTAALEASLGSCLPTCFLKRGHAEDLRHWLSRHHSGFGPEENYRRRRVKTVNTDSLHTFDLFATKSLWNLWNVFQWLKWELSCWGGAAWEQELLRRFIHKHNNNNNNKEELLVNAAFLINTRSISSASPVPCSSRPSAFVYSPVRSVSFILHFWGGEKPKICLHSGKPNIFSLIRPF